MAERRMFAKTIIDSDAFLDMPLSSQALYFHLSMRADDDGFVNNPKKIQRTIGASQDDLNLLVAKSFLIPFDSGIVVIKHWRIHNYIQNDRYKKTVYLEEKSLLKIKENKAYTVDGDGMDTECIQDGYGLETQVRLGKVSIGKVSIDKESIGEEKTTTRAKKKYGEYAHVMLTDSDYEKLKNTYGEDMTNDCIKYLDEYIEMKGYKAKNHYLCIKKWVVSAVKEHKPKTTNKVAQQLEDSYEMMRKWAEGENND